MASEGAKGVTGGPRDGADGRGFCFTERFGPLFAALGSQPVGGAAFPSFAERETLDALPVIPRRSLLPLPRLNRKTAEPFPASGFPWAFAWDSFPVAHPGAYSERLPAIFEC